MKVNIEPTDVSSDSSQANKVSRPGVQSLPPNIRRTFADDFVPAIIQEMGCSLTPWQNLDIDALQGCVNLVYPGLDHVIKKGDPLISSVSHNSLHFFPPLDVHLHPTGKCTNDEFSKRYCKRRCDQCPKLYGKAQDSRPCCSICQIWYALLRRDPLPLSRVRMHECPFQKRERRIQGCK